MFYLYVCIVLALISTELLNGSPYVETQLGKIKGIYMISDNGSRFSAFIGIPYAKPPVKDLRFKPAVSVSGWNDTLDATEDGHACIQYDVVTCQYVGDEDCLKLNVYTPMLFNNNDDDQRLFPVMVFIHGGGLLFGDSKPSSYGPQRLLDKDVVLVTFNYRLGAFGFLSTEDEVSPGNYGMLDQVQVLRWTQNNIRGFGGDPQRVTIFGHSIGATSVVLHMLSPLSKGLFHGAIALSGSALGIMENTVEDAKMLAHKLKCPSGNIREMLKCLRKKPAVEIVVNAATMDLAHPDSDSFSVFRVFRWVVDKNRGGGNSFLPDDPETLLRTNNFNHVPFITGIVKNEGLFYYLLIQSKNLTTDQANKLSQYISQRKDSPDPLASRIENLNLYNTCDNNLLDTQDKIKHSVDMLSDITVNGGVEATIKNLVSKEVPTYAYKIIHRGKQSFATAMAKMSNSSTTFDKMVSHGDEIQYLFHSSWFASNQFQDEADKSFSQILLTLFTNFAKTKIPSLDGNINLNVNNTKWHPVLQDKLQYLELSVKPQMVTGSLCIIPEICYFTSQRYNNKDEL